MQAYIDLSKVIAQGLHWTSPKSTLEWVNLNVQAKITFLYSSIHYIKCLLILKIYVLGIDYIESFWKALHQNFTHD